MPDESREHRPFAAEVKFLVTPDQGQAIREWARTRLTPDPYGAGEAGDAYTTSTLYCETAEFDVFRRRGSYGRSKYRIRRYSMSDIVFLERKLRTKEMLSKRRSMVPIDELAFLGGSSLACPRSWPGAWFGDRLATRRLFPICQVAYDRVARLTATPYGIARLTLDANLRACVAPSFEFQAGEPEPVMPDRIILELKFRMDMPAVFKALVEEFQLNPGPVSKYRSSVAALGLASAEGTQECRAS
jgi:hypothetical protein